jgi:hypothetical protein
MVVWELVGSLFLLSFYEVRDGSADFTIPGVWSRKDKQVCESKSLRYVVPGTRHIPGTSTRERTKSNRSDCRLGVRARELRIRIRVLDTCRGPTTR